VNDLDGSLGHLDGSFGHLDGSFEHSVLHKVAGYMDRLVKETI
jgi:hypothetical protein